ncbi:MAG: hypothetical protein HYZ50_17465 [Deltaproteobacteria bacterium]|nr:hypothetical protein [Deltaproteobacteria bacterium]
MDADKKPLAFTFVRCLREPHGLKRTVAWSVASLLACLGVSHALATECDTNICAGNPCTITGMHDLSGGCVLDFGATDVTIAKGATLKEKHGGGFTIKAHHLTLAGTLRTKAPPGDSAGSIDLILSGNFTTPKGSQGKIMATGPASGYGGAIDITAAGAVDLQGGGGLIAQPAGSIDITGTNLLVNEKLSALSVGSINLRSTSGPVTVNKTIRIDSIAALVGCGATLNVQAQGGDLVLNGLISQTNNCGSGFLDFSASGDIIVNGGIVANDKFQGDGGGYLTFRAGGNIEINAPISANGSPYGYSSTSGGIVYLSADGDVTVTKNITANAIGSSRGGCIAIAVGTGYTVSVRGKLEAKAPSLGGVIRLGNVSRTIDYHVCGASVLSPAIGAGTVLLAGTMDSSGTDVAGLNLVSYRTAFDATGGRLISGVNSSATGNIVQCNCADVSPMDGMCDANVCLSDPIGLDPAKVTPAVQLTPIVLVP